MKNQCVFDQDCRYEKMDTLILIFTHLHVDPCHETFTEIDFEPPNLSIEYDILLSITRPLVFKKAIICQKEKMLG